MFKIQVCDGNQIKVQRIGKKRWVTIIIFRWLI